MSWKPDLKNDPHCSIVLVARESSSTWDVYESVHGCEKGERIGTTTDFPCDIPSPSEINVIGQLDCTVTTLSGKYIVISGMTNRVDVQKKLVNGDKSLREVTLHVKSAKEENNS